MSLQLAAQHMASRGRGPDTQLVHMAPQEVAGLHALAKAHGGSLTINPDTGLPEAGFLSKILPMVLGAGAMMIPGLQGLGAGWIGAGIGGLTTLATGSLSKGLMAGLGAYGGAGLASGLMGAGTGAVSAGTGAEVASAANNISGVAPGVEAVTTGVQGTTPAMSGGFGSGVDAAAQTVQAPTAAELASSGDAVRYYPAQHPYGAPFAQHPLPASPINAAEAVPTTTAAPTTTPTPPTITLAQMSDPSIVSEATQERLLADRLAGTTPMGTAKAGLNAIYDKPDLFFNKGNLKYAGAALMPMLMQDPQKLAEKEKLKPFVYSYDPGRVADPYANRSGAQTGEVLHFNPSYTRIAAGGGLMDIGPVQAMSDRNEAQTLMANGGQMFAEGGETKAVKSVEKDPYYTMSGQSGDAFKYLMGQMPARAPAPAPVVVAPAVQPALQPVARTSGGRGLLAGSGADATLRPYTFDQVTGTYTALPVIQPDVYGSVLTPDSGSYYAQGGIAALAQGGPSHLGDYSDGGRLLKGPGDGVSDSIPATIGEKRPARLADGEFVVPARIVSELGNGSTEAGARKLYAMMDRVQKARKKSIGKDQVAVNSRTEKMLPA